MLWNCIHFFAACYVGDVPAPSETVVLSEKGKYAIGINADSATEHFMQGWGSQFSGQDHRSNPDFAKMFHNNGKNFMFLDGHVKWFAKGSGPFGELNNYAGQACPLAGAGVHPPYEPHDKGHCEFWPDWPN